MKRLSMLPSLYGILCTNRLMQADDLHRSLVLARHNLEYVTPDSMSHALPLTDVIEHQEIPARRIP